MSWDNSLQASAHDCVVVFQATDRVMPFMQVLPYVTYAIPTKK